MARILVQADDRETVLLDERSVTREHLSEVHFAAQLMERLEWAVEDEHPRLRRIDSLRSQE